MQSPRGWNVIVVAAQQHGIAKTSWNGSGNFKSNELGDSAWSVNARRVRATVAIGSTFRLRPSTLMSTARTPRHPINRQYLAALPGGTSRDLRHPLRFRLGRPRRRFPRSSVSTTPSSPDVTLDLYMEPRGKRGLQHVRRARRRARSRLAPVRHGRHNHRALADGSYRTDTRPPLPSKDFKTQPFRSNVVLLEWRTQAARFSWSGSKTDRAFVTGDHIGLRRFVRILPRLATTSSLKTTVWLSRGKNRAANYCCCFVFSRVSRAHRRRKCELEVHHLPRLLAVATVALGSGLTDSQANYRNGPSRVFSILSGSFAREYVFEHPSGNRTSAR